MLEIFLYNEVNEPNEIIILLVLKVVHCAYFKLN
jgi:hypothetical protein